MPTPTEPRAARTHAALVDALLVLLADRDLAAIGVTDLCRTAGVHRTTFYGHYESIEALASAAFASLLDSLVDVGPDPATFDASEVVEVQRAYVAALEATLEHVLANRAAYRRVFALTNDAGFRRDLMARVRHRADLAMQVWRRHGIGLGIDAEVMAARVAGGLVAALELWAYADRDDVVWFADQVNRTLPDWWPSTSD